MRSLVRDGATSEVAIGKYHPSRTRLSISGQKRHVVHVVQKFEARIVEIPQKNWVFMAKLHKLGFELILRPPYSPDLAPPTSFCSQTWLGGKKILSNDVIVFCSL